MNFVNEEGEILHEPMELEDTKGKVSTLQYDMYTPELTETVAACSGSPHINPDGVSALRWFVDIRFHF